MLWTPEFYFSQIPKTTKLKYIISGNNFSSAEFVKLFIHFLNFLLWIHKIRFKISYEQIGATKTHEELFIRVTLTGSYFNFKFNCKIFWKHFTFNSNIMQAVITILPVTHPLSAALSWNIYESWMFTSSLGWYVFLRT